MRLASLVPVSLFALALGAQDAGAKFAAGLERTLKQHPFFANVDFRQEAGSPPYLFYVQRPLKDSADYYRIVVNSYLPFLTELRRLFEQEYCQPLGLQPHADAPAYAIAVLATAGVYDDFARAVNDPMLHEARAHYDPKLRLAVTHQTAFGGARPGDERHALLHEMVHAMQHAYSSTGRMPAPVWFAEGLAEYRSACTHIARSLQQPPLQDRHLQAMLFGYANPLGRAHMLPLAELVQPVAYGQVIEAVQKRANGTARADWILPLFYSQAEMTVRFLHEGAGGKYRAGFQRYFQLVEAGGSGLQPFQQAFGIASEAAFAAIERDWLDWLATVLEVRVPGIGARIRGGGSGAVAGGAAPLPPPSGCNRSGLGWQPADAEARVQLARRLCAAGDFDAALAALPDAAATLPSQQPLLDRERQRIDALLQLREAVLADCERRKAPLRLADGGGRIVRREPAGVVLQDGKDQRTVPLRELGLPWLLAEGRRLRRFDGRDCWLEAWLRWLSGESRAQLQPLLGKQYSTVQALRQDLEADCDQRYGAAAAALLTLQELPLPDATAEARQALAALQAALRDHQRAPLLQQRRSTIDELARALAERAFAADDAAAMGIDGKVEVLADGRVRCLYDQPQQVADADFTLVTDSELKLDQEVRISYEGPTQLQAAGKHWQLIGSGFLRWAVPLAGAQEVEIDYVIPGGQGYFQLVLCYAPEHHLLVGPHGVAEVWDVEQRVQDSVGTGPVLTLEEIHRLRVVHDGKKTLQTFLDGKPVAKLPNVAGCLGGELLLMVRSSEPVQLHRLCVTGKLDPSDPLQLRERFVQTVLRSLWP